MACDECVHIELCKKYHDQFTYDILPSIGCDDFKSKKPMTNADRIRAMSDAELAVFMADKYMMESCMWLADEGYEPTEVQKKAIKRVSTKEQKPSIKKKRIYGRFAKFV